MFWSCFYPFTLLPQNKDNKSECRKERAQQTTSLDGRKGQAGGH